MAENTSMTTQPRADLKQAESTRSNVYFSPRVDIFETDQELVLYADVPGATANDIELRFENGELILQGKIAPRSHPGHCLLQEYDVGDFYRVFQVHESIDASRIEAENKNGVLIVHLPKEEKARPKQVKVKAE